MCNKLVSIIIPTYNRGDFLKQTIDNCKNQTYTPIEIIVVDDGSTAINMKEFLQEYIEDNTITYIFQNNKGLAGARNTGLKHAKGDYIQFLDDDDLMELDKIEKQINFLEKNKTFFGCYCKSIYFKDNIENEIMTLDKNKNNCNVYEELLKSNFLTVHSILIRKPDIEFDESLTSYEDYDFWLRLFFDESKKLHYLNNTSCYVRVHGSNMSSNKVRMVKNEIVVLEKMLKKDKKLDLINYRLYKLKSFISENCNENKKYLLNRTKFYYIIFSMYKLKVTLRKYKIIKS